MSHLDNIGFKISSAEAFDALVSEIFAKGQEIEVDEGKYICYQDSSGAEIYAQIDEAGEFLGFMPFYDTKLTKTVQVSEAISYPDATVLDKRYMAKSVNNVYPFVFDVVNAKQRLLSSTSEDLAFVAFPTEIAYFAKAEDFLEEMPELSTTYFIPVGLMNEEGGAKENPEPYAMFIGEVKSIELKRNTFFDVDFYVLELAVFEGDVTVVSLRENFKIEPQVGGFVHGVFWMSAKV